MKNYSAKISLPCGEYGRVKAIAIGHHKISALLPFSSNKKACPQKGQAFLLKLV